MPINWEDVESFGAGTINDMLFDLPEVIAKATGKNIFEEMRQRNPTAYELGKTASIVGGLIPGGALIKGLKGLKTADTAMDTLKGIDRFADIAKTGKGMDTVLDAARAADEAADIAKAAKKTDTAADFMKGIKSFEKVDDSERIVSPRVKKLLENIEKMPDKEINPFSKNDAFDIIEGSKKIPDGWYVHGKNPKKTFGGKWPIEYTRDIDIAKSGNYGTEAGVWISKPTKNAIIYDFSNTATNSMDNFIKKLLPKYKKYKMGKLHFDEVPYFEALKPYNIMDDIDSFENGIREAFSPPSIVDSAGAYDNPDFLDLFELFDEKPDFIYTPDGAVALPGAKNVQHINLSKIAGIKPNPIKKITIAPAIKTEKYTRQPALGGWTEVIANDGRRANFTEYASDNEIKKWIDSGMDYMQWLKSGGA